jgi:hypothetical protein
MAADDENVVGEFTDWLAVLLDARGDDAGDVADIIEALKVVVAPSSQQAADILEATARGLGSI